VELLRVCPPTSSGNGPRCHIVQTVNTPSAESSSVFKWAWYHAKEFRTRFWVAAAVFSLVVALIVSRLPLPPHPTAIQNLIASALAVVGATVLVGVGSYACALVAAPFQQRNMLRAQLLESAGTIAGLRSAPVSQAHGERLRQIAARLRECVEHNEPLDYGADPDTWRLAFNEHFPALQSALDKAGEADAAFVVLKERLRREVAAAGMDEPPWISEDFLPWLATTIQARALQRILGTPYNFDWNDDDISEIVWIGHSIFTTIRVLDSSGHADVPALTQYFEEFFSSVESWPEAADIRTKWDGRDSAAQTAIGLLAAAANTDPIMSRCFLCRGS